MKSENLFTSIGEVKKYATSIPASEYESRSDARLWNSKSIPIVLLDGGLGTSLESASPGSFSDNPLWSSGLLKTSPELMLNTHLEFLRSGAQVIEAATYQTSFETYARAGYSRSEARTLMRKAIRLADEARHIFIAKQQKAKNDDDIEKHKEENKIRIALSLGPYGAMIPGAQEFTGMYLPPFGASVNRIFFTKTEIEDGEEERAVEALERFYDERLTVFFGNEHRGENEGKVTSSEEKDRVGDLIDIVAFETVPLLREIKAIRRAMGKVFGRGRKDRPFWWISTVWPDGRFPGLMPGESENESKSAEPKDVLDALVGAESGEASLNEYPNPDTIRINCTNVDHLEGTLNQWADILSTSSSSRRFQHDINSADETEMPAEDERKKNISGSRLWLVVYPNGYMGYDVAEKRWEDELNANSGSSNAKTNDESHETASDVNVMSSWNSAEDTRDVWTEKLASIVSRQIVKGVWDGIIVGGCCKTSAKDV